MPSNLITLIRQEYSRESPEGVRALVEDLLNRYGEVTQAILFYGSCFRTGDDTDGLVDLYVIVDSYRAALPNRLQAVANKLLPPNVFYLELPIRDRMVRTKYAVLSLKDFQRGTSKHWFHSYLWGRFAQPVGLLYVRNNQVEKQVRVALAQAVITFITRVMPELNKRFMARDLWHHGLLLSYKAELRSEKPDKLVNLVDAAPEYYKQVTHAAMVSVPFKVEAFAEQDGFLYHAYIPTSVRYRSRLAWTLRRVQGKVLSIMRLFKAVFTFEGGVDYIQWKIERHSGVRVEWTPRLKRHPLLAVCILSWRLYRKGGFR
jgi:Phosphatidate cytidylyltransferase, mitochondrial